MQFYPFCTIKNGNTYFKGFLLMEIVTIIIQDWLCPLFLTFIFGFLIYHLAMGVRKALQTESENSIRITIKKDDLPDSMGSLFGDSFASIFSHMFGGDKR